MIKLDEHQEQAVELVLQHKKYGLFMEVGTGKTYTALEIYKRVQPRTCLIVSIAKTINSKQWEEEIVKYLGYLPNNIDLLSYNTLTLYYPNYLNRVYDLIIIDEAHKIKAPAKSRQGTKITRLMRTLSKRAQYVVPMTGTPVANDYVDVFNIFRNCDIDCWDHKNENEFIQEYYNFQVRDFQGRGFTTIVKGNLKDEMKDKFLKERQSKSFVVKSKQVLQLLPRKVKIIYAHGISETDIYKDIKYKKILRFDDFQDTLSTLDKRIYEHQAAQGFIYRPYTLEKEMFRFNNSKIDKFREWIVNIKQEFGKVVVSYYYQEDLKAILKVLDDLKYTHTRDVKEFENEKDIFLLHYTVSEGLNLQHKCNAMLIYSFNEGYLSFEQLSGRIWRRGQTKQPYIFVMISKNTIDERIWQSIVKKESKSQFVKREGKEDGEILFTKN